MGRTSVEGRMNDELMRRLMFAVRYDSGLILSNGEVKAILSSASIRDWADSLEKEDKHGKD